MIRTKDGGQTWGDPTFVRCWGATETDFAVDPKDPDHILAMSRKQRGLVRPPVSASMEGHSIGQIRGKKCTALIISAVKAQHMCVQNDSGVCQSPRNSSTPLIR